MLKLDHLTVIAPSIVEGVSHVQDCLGLAVPYGSSHDYMGTHNHRLQLGNSVYLEIVAVDPDGTEPNRSRWFGFDNEEQIRLDWEAGRRFRGWVANIEDIDAVISKNPVLFGEKVPLPTANPTFSFSIPQDGSLPSDGAVPLIIDHTGDRGYIAEIPDMGARLTSFTLEHPSIKNIEKLYQTLAIDHPPFLVHGPELKYRALIQTANGARELT